MPSPLQACRAVCSPEIRLAEVRTAQVCSQSGRVAQIRLAQLAWRAIASTVIRFTAPDGRAPPDADAAAAVVSDHGEARESERAHDRDPDRRPGARAAASWRDGCE